MHSKLCNLGYATRLTTDASRKAPVDNEWLCTLGYAIYAVRSRPCNLRYATRLSTALRAKRLLTMSGYAIKVMQSMKCDLGYAI